METIFMNTENSETNKPNKFFLNFSQRLDLKSPNKHAALWNLSVCYTWKNTRKQYKKNKLKIIALTWNDELELPDGFCFVLYIQDYIEYIIKKHETLKTSPLIHVYINRINNRLVLKIKHEYELQLKFPDAMKLFCSTKNEVTEVVLVQSNLVDN